MHQDPEHEDYDDDEYNYYPEYSDYGYSKQFKFDWSAWEKWLSDSIKEIVKEDDNMWIFGNYQTPSNKSNSNTKKLSDKYFMYLGNNQYDESIWKAKYFISDKINRQYQNHISSRPGYFLKQPYYYKGMFDNLN